MSSVVIVGDTSGSVTLQAPAVAGSSTLTLPTTSGTVAISPASGYWPESSGGTGTSTGYNGFKNRIINGGMRIWQRAIAATTVTLNGPGYNTVDRFFAYQNGSAGVQTSQLFGVSLTGFRFGIKWGRPNTNTTTGITVLGQVIESANCTDLQGQPVTLSFWASCGANFSSASSQLGVQVFTGTGIDQSSTSMVSGSWFGSATPINSVATLTTTWQQFTFTGTFGSTIQQAGIYFSWTPVGTAGIDDNVYITGVQLEKGPVATSFDWRPYGTELALCQRYYEKSYDQAVFPGTASAVGYSTNGGVTNVNSSARASRATTYYKVSKRTDATATTYDTAGASGKVNFPDTTTGIASTIITAGENSFTLEASSGAVTDTRMYWHWTASAEL